MIRVVLDTNIIVSALLQPLGPPAQVFVLAIRERGLWVRSTETVRACPDPDDDIFLECAQVAHANYLVTGNLKHFPTSWLDTKIVTPRWLLDQLPPERPENVS
jgi:predicted nucleic acid-binding protein